MNKEHLDFVYPNGAHKAVTLRFDDGPDSDRKMVDLLNRYDLKATFYLVGSFLEREKGINIDEVNTLYKGHEIANHTFFHKDPSRHILTSEDVENELELGKRFLEKLTNNAVSGYAYVCSTYGNIGADEYKRILTKTAHKYAIMGRETYCFEPDINDRFDIGQSFRFKDDMLLEKASEFCKLDTQHLTIMLVMAHTYEFDDPKYNCSWQKVEDFYKTVSGRSDIWYATNGEVIEYLLDVQKFKNSDSLLNTTESTLYINTSKNIVKLKPKEKLLVSIN